VWVITGKSSTTLDELRNFRLGCKADTVVYPRYIAAFMGTKTMDATTESGADSTTDGLDGRRRKLRFRSWHRGMLEMDLILGRFADAEIGALTDDEIDQYERLLEIPDTDFFPIVTGEHPVPANLDCPVLRKILASRPVRDA
jgi:antitoxin CptB